MDVASRALIQILTQVNHRNWRTSYADIQEIFSVHCNGGGKQCCSCG
ncbi:hypothetical protein VCR6J2_230387 [Vibrio coralliirubri]|nr:hypothetical protein VCR6J2_230387 [Vibrio coralliirubri]